jgi:glycosyltransferase involved in cell wall biosynthesis
MQVLCAGTGAPHKGQAVLLRAVQLADHRDMATVTMIGVGENSYARALEREVWAAAVGSVTFVPIAADPAPWFASADVLVCPSYTETFPGVLLEARLAGLPVVASDLPGTRVAAAGHPVTWVPPGDARALADALTNHRASGESAVPTDVTVPDSTERATRLLELLSGVVARG